MTHALGESSYGVVRFMSRLQDQIAHSQKSEVPCPGHLPDQMRSPLLATLQSTDPNPNATGDRVNFVLVNGDDPRNAALVLLACEIVCTLRRDHL